VASNDESITKHVNAALFSMACSPHMLKELLRFFRDQQGGNLTTQRWIITMLAMLSSEKEWLEEVFVTDECAHPYERNASYSRVIKVPLASRLTVSWDPRTCTKEKDVVTLTTAQATHKFSGPFENFEVRLAPQSTHMANTPSCANSPSSLLACL
jgi:hypothetical protein